MSNARTLANTINANSEIVVPSGGIQFADATNANTVANESNLIEQDGYEQGTWTPTNYTGGTVIGNNYTKIGRLVTVSCYFANVTFSSDELGGLPFASLAYGIGSITFSNSTNVNGITSNGSGIQFRQNNGNATPNGSYMMLSVTYQCSA